MPLGTTIHNIEITLGKGGQFARAAGAVAKLIAKEATVGQVGNVGVNQKILGRAGSKCWLGKRPVVRGVVMNLVDHPHGGGEDHLVEKSPQPLGPCLEEKVGKRRNIVIVSFFVVVNRRSWANDGLRMVDSQSTALIHLATSTHTYLSIFYKSLGKSRKLKSLFILLFIILS
ncbi:hypothetical protein AMTRI_Chr02g260150 [Amborella trichopoda]